MSEISPEKMFEMANHNMKIVGVLAHQFDNPLLSRVQKEDKKNLKRFDPSDPNSVFSIVSDEEYRNYYRDELLFGAHIPEEQVEGMVDNLMKPGASIMFVSPARQGSPEIIVCRASEVAKFNGNTYGDQAYNISILQEGYLNAVANLLCFNSGQISVSDLKHDISKLLDLPENTIQRSALASLGEDWANRVSIIEKGFEKALYFDDYNKASVFGTERLKELARVSIVVACIELANNGRNLKPKSTYDEMYQAGIDRKNTTLKPNMPGGQMKSATYRFIETIIGEDNNKGKGLRFRELFINLTNMSYEDFFVWVLNTYPSKASDIDATFQSLMDLNKRVDSV